MLFMIKSQFSIGRKVFLQMVLQKPNMHMKNFDPFVIPHVGISLKWVIELSADVKNHKTSRRYR